MVRWAELTARRPVPSRSSQTDSAIPFGSARPACPDRCALPELRRPEPTGRRFSFVGLLCGLRQPTLEKKRAEARCQGFQQCGDFVEAPAGLSRRGQIAAAVDFHLDRMNSSLR